MDTGLLIARLVFGLLMAVHGSQKLFGWFGGPGMSGTEAFLEGLGFRPGRLVEERSMSECEARPTRTGGGHGRDPAGTSSEKTRENRVRRKPKVS